LFLTPVFFVTIEGAMRKTAAPEEGPGTGPVAGAGPALTTAEEPPHA
jgi:hypothetical protein